MRELYIQSFDAENKCLVLNVGEGRVRLVALSDLIDLITLERMEESERLERAEILLKIDKTMGICTKDGDYKLIYISDCLLCPLCLPPNERVDGMICHYEQKIIDK